MRDILAVSDDISWLEHHGKKIHPVAGTTIRILYQELAASQYLKLRETTFCSV